MRNEFKNAQITDISISMEDHDMLIYRIIIRGDGWGCAVGDRSLGTADEYSNYWSADGVSVVAIMKILSVIGVKKWEDLKNRYCRVYFDDTGTIASIGNIILDKWFDFNDFYNQAYKTKPGLFELES